MSARPRHGFTLIEISILLVVIGLVIGAISVGRDLIEAARVRQQISQIEQFKVAVSTFRSKYGGIPGDLRAADAAGFGMASRSGNPGDGNGDGVLGACATFGPEDHLGCETVLFWNDLSYAELIPGTFTMPSTGSIIDSLLPPDFAKYLPETRIGNQTHLMAFTLGSSWLNFSNLPICKKSFCLSLVQPLAIGFGMLVTGDPMPELHVGITALQAFAIDAKVDDGKPFTGTVAGGFSYGTPVVTHSSWYDDPSYQRCLTMAGTGDSPDDFGYVVSGEFANQPECSMNFAGL